MNRNFPVIDFIGWLHTNHLLNGEPTLQDCVDMVTAFEAGKSYSIPSRENDDETFTVEERLDGVIDYQVKLLRKKVSEKLSLPTRLRVATNTLKG